MTKIEKLETRLNGDQYGNIYGIYYPTNKELMDKINEIIDVVNTLVKTTEEDKS